MKKPNLTYIDPENYKRFSIPTASGAKQVEGITVRALRKALESADPDMLVLYMAEQPGGVMLGCIGGAAFAESPPMVVLFGPEALGAIKKMAMEPLTTTDPPPAPVEAPTPPVPPVDRSNVCTTDGFNQMTLATQPGETLVASVTDMSAGPSRWVVYHDSPTCKFMAAGENVSPRDVAMHISQPLYATVDGPCEEIAARAYHAFSDLWSMVDTADDISVFKTDLSLAISSEDALESMRRTFLEWGHSLDLIAFPEFYSALVESLANKNDDQLALGF